MTENQDKKTKKHKKEKIVLPPFGLAEDILGTAGFKPKNSSPATEKKADAPKADIEIPAEHDKESEEALLEDEEKETLHKIVTFFLGEEEYGLFIEKVREINRVQDITRVPNTHDHVLGVINLRGKIVPVIEIKKRLNIGRAVIGGKSRIVVIEHGSDLLGLLVDRVSRVMDVSSKQIDKVSGEMMIAQDFIEKVVKIEDERLIILLDTERVLEKTA